MASATHLKTHPDINESSAAAIANSGLWHGCHLSPDVSSFEKTYKTAYSHGLEKIYQLENVDIKSVRRITDTSSDQAIAEDMPELSVEDQPADQLEFDFGDGFRCSREHFIMQEPIHVLCLAKHVEKCLIERGVRLIKDLLAADLRTFVFIKGIGQGHIDDIQRKLSAYVHGKTLKDAKKLDFASWLRTLVADVEAKKLFVLLESFGLSGMIKLSPAEAVEVRRLSEEKRLEWNRATIARLVQEDKFRQLHDDLKDVYGVFVKPWMRSRFGIATEAEITERLLNLSEIPEEGKAVLEFFRKHYFHGKFPLSEFLKVVEEDLYCIDVETAQIYKDIIEKVMSYFYKNDLRYPLEQLANFVQSEFAQVWNGYGEGCIEHMLRICPSFRVRKDDTGKLGVKLS